MSFLIQAVEKGLVPHFILKMGIRNLLKKRLAEIQENSHFHKQGIIEKLDKIPMAIETDIANQQHYELPTKFFTYVLGKNLKYSCSFYSKTVKSLDEAEDNMLNLYCERTQLKDGMHILELGCGWGSLTLFMARKFPKAHITAISNSKSQCQFIENKMKAQSLNNVKVITTDINDFHIQEQFDRVISIEMFEHVRNYKSLFKNIKKWLKDDGKLFVHIFCHKEATYFFETKGDDNWMGKYFFTGGIMPSFDLFEKVQNDLKLIEKWKINGVHYQKTSQAWFFKMAENKEQIMEVMKQTYGKSEAYRWFNRWKIFFASCAELFGYDNGHEWFVGHYLFEKKKES